MNAQHRSPSFHEMRVGGLVRPLLSAREKEVLLTWLAADSKTEAARRLFISVGTLNTHLQRIRLKYATAGVASIRMVYEPDRIR